MEGNRYTADEDRFGGIIISDTETGRDVYLQPGDDSTPFREDWEAIVRIWTRSYGTNKDGSTRHRRGFGPFRSYSEHFDVIASAYF